MKAANFKLNTVLAGAVGLACLVLVLLRTFAPYLVLPLADIPNLARSRSSPLWWTDTSTARS